MPMKHKAVIEQNKGDSAYTEPPFSSSSQSPLTLYHPSCCFQMGGEPQALPHGCLISDCLNQLPPIAMRWEVNFVICVNTPTCYAYPPPMRVLTSQ